MVAVPLILVLWLVGGLIKYGPHLWLYFICLSAIVIGFTLPFVLGTILMMVALTRRLILSTFVHLYLSVGRLPEDQKPDDLAKMPPGCLFAYAIDCLQNSGYWQIADTWQAPSNAELERRLQSVGLKPSPGVIISNPGALREELNSLV